MTFFTFFNGRSLGRAVMVLLCLGLGSTEFLPAQTETNGSLPTAAPAPSMGTNGAPVTPAVAAGDATNALPVNELAQPPAGSEPLSSPLVKPPALTGTESVTDSG